MMNRSRLMLGLLSLLIAALTFAQTGQPVQQPWSGWAQCQITIQAPGYTHTETHQWKIAGGGTSRANQQFYPTTWTVVGNGSLQRVSGPTTVSAQWQVNGTLSTIEIGTTLHLDRITLQRWTGHGPARGALTGTEVSTTNGVPRSRFVVLDIQQWAFPTVEGATTGTRMTGSNTVPFDGLRGPMNPPSGAMGTAACTWDFARGASQTAQPPTVSAQPTPTTPAPGGAVSSGVPSGGGGGSGTSTSVPGGGSPGGTTTGGGAGGSASTPTGSTPTISSGGRGVGAGTGTVIATADLGINGVGAQDFSQPNLRAVSLPLNGSAQYGLGVDNLGPGAADGATITIPASSGLTKTGVSCHGQGGATPLGQQGLQSATITVAQIESGLVIPNFPAGGSVGCLIHASVTGTAGSNATMTVNVRAPGGVSDPNPGNNTATNTLPIK